MNQYLEHMVAHLEWADSTVWRAAMALEDAGDDEKLVFLLHHVHVVQRAFLRIWRGEGLDDLPELSAFDGLVPLMAWARDGHRELRGFLAERSEDEMNRELELPFKEQVEKRWDRPIGPVTLWESLIQVAMHTTHHRGQILTRLRELGSEPPLVDFIAWTWWGRAPAEWPDVVEP